MFLEKDELPRNPYYNLVCYFRTVEVEFEILLEKHHFEIPNDNSLGANNGRTACIAENSSFWGAPAVVKVRLRKNVFEKLPLLPHIDDRCEQPREFAKVAENNA